MPEVEREQVLAQRLEEMQSRADKFNLSKLLAAQDVGNAMAEDSVAQAAKRVFSLSVAITQNSISVTFLLDSVSKGEEC